MSTHKSIDRICVVITVIAVILSIVFCNGKSLGIKTTAHAIGYEDRLFDHSKVHSLDIVINDWDSFIETCESEEYSPCNVIIDGEAVRNVGIRGKGNTSLSSVKNMNSSRYSFKIEFDQYENGKTYHGLDKLCLNNIIQDNTYMKDYLAYTLMNDFGADTPLCSFVYITVNGDDWGLYLAVEAIENSFLERNYGSNYGELYKPDSMSFGGGGPGNGKDFSMGNFINKESTDKNSSENDVDGFTAPGNFGGGIPDFGNGEMPQFDPDNMPEDFDFSSFDPSEMFGGDGEMPDFGGGKGGFGMGSDDVKLKYTDDSIDSYSNIFNNAKTAVDTADKKRLIRSLKALSDQSDIESTLDTDEVLRYFVVHNFLCNGDSYTGQMIHNYYLYEEDGQLSMIPWDYNLAYGSFMGGQASSSVNSAIDTPVSGDMSDRPMVSWIYDSEEYTEQYHQLFTEFINSTDFEKLISDTAALINEYVEKDPTKFCTYDEFQKGVEAISSFCTLRAESVKGQLNGSIPSTSDGQKEDSSSLIDTGDLNISDMGSMGGGFGGGQKGGKSEKTDKSRGFSKKENSEKDQQSISGSATSAKMLSNITPLKDSTKNDSDNEAPGSFNGEKPDFGGQPPEGFGGNMPGNFDPDNMPEGFDQDNMPEGFDPDNMPGGFTPGDMPEDFDPENISDNIPSDKDTDTDDEDAAVSDASSSEGNDNKEAPDKQDEARNGERPQMGDFPGMNDGTPANNTPAYILLGISSLILLAGIIYAYKFRR